MGVFMDARDRLFHPVPLPADRYDRGFFLALSALLAFTGVCYWSLSAYWRVQWFAGEDGLTEWASTAMYVGAAAMAALGARLLAQSGRPRLALAHGALVAVLALVALEELSWGQRLFGWSTPEGLGRVNEQNETNLHNIAIFERAFYTMLLWACLLGVLGAIARALPQRHGRATAADFLLPSPALAPSLALVAIFVGEGAAFEAVQDAFPSRPPGTELQELILGLALLFYTASNLKRAAELRRCRRQFVAAPARAGDLAPDPAEAPDA